MAEWLRRYRSRSFCTTHLLMPMIICAKYGKNPTRTIHAVEQIKQDVLYFSSFIVKLWLNDLKVTGQHQRSLSVTHTFMLVIICAYEKNPSRTVGMQDGQTSGYTDRRTEGMKPIYSPATSSFCGGIMMWSGHHNIFRNHDNLRNLRRKHI